MLYDLVVYILVDYKLNKYWGQHSYSNYILDTQLLNQLGAALLPRRTTQGKRERFNCQTKTAELRSHATKNTQQAIY